MSCRSKSGRAQLSCSIIDSGVLVENAGQVIRLKILFRTLFSTKHLEVETGTKFRLHFLMGPLTRPLPAESLYSTSIQQGGHPDTLTRKYTSKLRMFSFINSQEKNSSQRRIIQICLLLLAFGLEPLTVLTNLDIAFDFIT